MSTLRADRVKDPQSLSNSCSGSEGPPEGLFFHAATAVGEGGISLVEIFGMEARKALGDLFSPSRGPMPEDGQVRLGVLRDARGFPVDEVLLTAPGSRTSWCRLPAWTLSCHGGAFIQGRLREILSSAGGRELDRNAVILLARSLGLLDGIQAEALRRLPWARTARSALYLCRMDRGELSRSVEGILGLLEAGDLPAARRAMEVLLRDSPAAVRLVEPRRILLAGRPNAGKSALFNRLAGRERAAVTPMAGTTRDILEETISVSGYPVILLDGPGLRRPDEGTGAVEAEGMRRVRKAATDLVLYLVEHEGPLEGDEEAFLDALPRGDALVVRTKADLRAAPQASDPQGGDGIRISSRTGAGIDALLERLRAQWLGPPEGECLGPAPFSAAQAEAFRRVARASSVDELRIGLVEFLADRPGVCG